MPVNRHLAMGGEFAPALPGRPRKRKVIPKIALELGRGLGASQFLRTYSKREDCLGEQA